MNIQKQIPDALTEGGEDAIKHCVKRLGNDALLLYRLTEKIVKRGPADLRHMYSFTVTKISFDGQQREVKSVPDVSRNRAEALRLFELICRGRVTPSTLCDVLSDMVCI